MAVCCCSLAGTAACQHCSQNPFATDVWTNKTVTVSHVDAKPFGKCNKANPKQTNADRIRSMTDEELAEFMCSNVSNGTVNCAFCAAEEFCRMGHNGWLDWLKQECE